MVKFIFVEFNFTLNQSCLFITIHILVYNCQRTDYGTFTKNISLFLNSSKKLILQSVFFPRTVIGTLLSYDKDGASSASFLITIISFNFYSTSDSLQIYLLAL